ncbi:hypothetical protein HY623_02640 [Candidatus Uhrbacteria bacterium]|nr:hypothetical protein [Candidatus Uhrbacteria bacterium]
MIADISFLERRIEVKQKLAQKKFRGQKRTPVYSLLALIVMITGTLGSYLTLSYAATSIRRSPLVFQGRITDANYVPIADSTTRRMVFRIYNAATAGNCQWSTGNAADTAEATNCAIDITLAGDNAAEDNASVATTITRGVFSVPIGDTGYHANMRALRLDFNNAANEVYYIEISVKNSSGEYETLSPRIRIGSSAYAYNADELDGITSASFAQLVGQAGGQILIGGTATTDDLTLRTTSGAGESGADMIFQVGNNGATEAMRILNGGNIGIGDTSPDSLLNIQSSAAENNGIIVSQTNAGDYDPFIQFELTDGTASYTMGIDDSVAGDPFKISTTALGSGDLLTIDSRINTSGVSAFSFTTPFHTAGITSVSTAEYTTLTVTPPVILLSGQTQVTSQMDSIVFSQPTVSDAQAITVDDAALLTLQGAPLGQTGVTISDSYALKINTATAGGTTRTYGLYVDAMTGGVGTHYAAAFASGNVGIGTATPGQKLSVAGTFGILEGGASPTYYTIFQGGDQAANLTYTLPSADGTNGQVLATNGGGTLSWTTSSAGSSWSLLGNAFSGTEKLGSTNDYSVVMINNNTDRFRFTTKGQIEILSSAESVLIGEEAGKNQDNSAGRYNVFVGRQAGLSNTTGSENVASGYQALYSNTTGTYNTAIGPYALLLTTTGTRNTASGFEALRGNTTGYDNTANGYVALRSNTTGYHNVASGRGALYLNTTGYQNVANGFEALYSNTTGTYNTANGYQALYSNTTGTYNTANGISALSGNTTGSNNIAIGVGAGDNITSGSNNIIIGFSVDAPVATNSNQLSIGNLIFATGGFGTGTTIGSGNVGIGTATPQSTLQVDGGYIQFDFVTVAPNAADCDDAAEAGRVIVFANGAGAAQLYVCDSDDGDGSPGWVTK